MDWLKRRVTAVHNDYSLSWLQILLAHHSTVGQRQLVCRAARSLHGLEKTWEWRGENTEIPLERFSQSKMQWTAKRLHLQWHVIEMRHTGKLCHHYCCLSDMYASSVHPPFVTHPWSRSSSHQCIQAMQTYFTETCKVCGFHELASSLQFI